MNSSYGDSTNAAHGRARIPGGDDDGSYDPYRDMDRQQSTRPVSAGAASGRASVGRASVGQAGVRPASGYSDEYETTRPVTGRASVGRATVSPDDFLEEPGQPPKRLVVPPGPGARAARKARSKKARRRNLILSAIALMIMLTGLTVVGGTYYFDKVPLP